MLILGVLCALGARKSESISLFLFLMTVVRSIHCHLVRSLALASDFFAGLPELAGDGELGFVVEFGIPIAQRVAVPGRFRFKLWQLEFFPELAGALHIF